MYRTCMRIFMFVALAGGAALPAFAAEALTVTSPDGNVAISFELKVNPQL